MGQFLKHQPCEKCGSSDGKAIYADGSWYCWVCQDKKASLEYLEQFKSKTTKKGFMRQNAVKDMQNKTEEIQKPISTKPAITEEEQKSIRASTVVNVDYRGVTSKTAKAFGVRYAVDEEGDALSQYYPCTQEGQLVGYKIRDLPKTFRSAGRTGADVELFGQWKFTRGGKYVLITEGECFLPDTKVLTRTGWVTLSEYEPYMGEVMQANGEFAFPLAKVYKDYDGDMVSYSSGSFSIDMTPNHNMLRIQNGEHIKVRAGDLTQKHKPVPRVVNFKSDADNLRARLQVMFSADFTFRKEGDIYGAFKKQRKIERAKYLLDLSGVRYKVAEVAGGFTSFFVHRGHGLDVSKKFDYARDLTSASTIIEEVFYWDGNSVPNRNQIEYSSVISENAEFVQTCAHLCGYVSTIIPRQRDKYSWYKVSILKGKSTSSTQKGYKLYNYSGKVACLQMPNGTLMVKQGQSVSLSGNCDALSAWQMLKDYNESRGSDFETAVVSPTVGANASKQIAAQYKFFDSFDNIILGYDSDAAGQKAAEEIIKHLPKGKVKIMQMSRKDANEYLTAGDEKAFIRDFYNAKAFVPVGVLPSDQLYDRIIQQTSVEKLPFPPFMGKLNEMFVGGIPLGHIINIAASTAVGKTTLVNEMIYYWIFNSPHLVGVVSMELDAGQYGEALMSRHLGRKLALIPDANDKIKELDRNKTKAEELLQKPDGTPRFYLLDNRDGSIEEIQDTIEELVVACGCKVIVIDVLTDCLDGLTIDEQAVFMKWAKGFIKSHGITFVFINHTRKPAAGQSSSSMPDEASVFGSSTVTKSASANIFLQRDKTHDDPVVRNSTKIMVPKNRVYGITGPAGAVYYDNETHTLHNLDDWLNGNM